MSAIKVERAASLSKCLTYRYSLRRWWDHGDKPNKHLIFILLNPSTADALVDDATVRRGIGFAQRSNYNTMTFLNLFAYRTRYPSELKKAIMPVGVGNDTWIRATILEQKHIYGPPTVIAAWGAHGGLYDRDLAVLYMLLDNNVPVFAFKTLKGGHPGHILYLPNKAKWKPFKGRKGTHV